MKFSSEPERIRRPDSSLNGLQEEFFSAFPPQQFDQVDEKSWEADYTYDDMSQRVCEREALRHSVSSRDGTVSEQHEDDISVFTDAPSAYGGEFGRRSESFKLDSKSRQLPTASDDVELQSWHINHSSSGDAGETSVRQSFLGESAISLPPLVPMDDEEEELPSTARGSEGAVSQYPPMLVAYEPGLDAEDIQEIDDNDRAWEQEQLLADNHLASLSGESRDFDEEGESRFILEQDAMWYEDSNFEIFPHYIPAEVVEERSSDHRSGEILHPYPFHMTADLVVLVKQKPRKS